MITIYKTEKTREVKGEVKTIMELRGLSTDTKPTTNDIDNGSVFIEIDTGKIYMYDLESNEWKEI